MPDITEPTPLQRLDEAVREYVEAAGPEGDLAGWALAFQTQRIVPDENLIPLAFASDFTFGAGTSPEAALGMLEVTRARLIEQLVRVAEE